MKVNYTVNRQKVIQSWSAVPFDETQPFIEVDNPHSQIHVGFSKVVNGEFVENKEEYEAYVEEQERQFRESQK